MELSFLFFLAASFLFLYRRTERYLRFFQQEEYNSKRFFYWYFSKQAFDTRASLVIFALFFIPWWVGALLLAGLWALEPDPKKEGKLPLKLSERALRIFRTTYACLIAFQLLLLLCNSDALFLAGQLLLFQSPPFFLIAAVGLLHQDEQKRQEVFRKRAKKTLEKVSPFVIGITGSYGKTSTKCALGEVLQVSLGSTFWPEKGVNTEMGIVREINTHLHPHTSYAVIEMGAYGRGSIRRLCTLTPPAAAIITAVGKSHLERFGSEEAILKGKGELADALPDGGILVCNGDNLGARIIAERHPNQRVFLYGFDHTIGDLYCVIRDYVQTEQGATFSFECEGQTYKGTTQMHGKAALSNLAATFTMAYVLGADPELILGAIANLKAVDNRLQKVDVSGVTYLQDAYNSNPEGFSAALDVLNHHRKGKKILMTPGIVEMADQSREVHETIGRKAAQICDWVVIVGDMNREALQRGLQSGKFGAKYTILAKSRAEALEKVTYLAKEGDAVLIENDFPDLLETTERF